MFTMLFPKHFRPIANSSPGLAGRNPRELSHWPNNGTYGSVMQHLLDRKDWALSPHSMNRMRVADRHTRRSTTASALAVAGAMLLHASQDFTVRAAPSLVDHKLAVKTVATGLTTPTTMLFLGTQDMLVLEKNTGKVQRVIDGVIQPTPALDLAVNFASERGLLGSALHPDFPANPGVYLFWTESTTGADSSVLSEVPLLGNRVDRFIWDGENLTFEDNLIRLRAFQADDTNRRADGTLQERGNHDGGILKFGPDGKLYIYVGDTGRRGQMQNLPDGPGCVTHPCSGTPTGNLPDDQFGGPEPDDAHLTGVILRLNDDGTSPASNPFFVAGELRGGGAGANLQKVFAYGIRNGFGMAFDPFSGSLWEAQNGDDTFTEINRVDAGVNLGWVQIMGPLNRLAEFKEIETSEQFFGLQQLRWPPTNIADRPGQALGRLFRVYEGGDEFGTVLAGRHEVPPVTTDASAIADFSLNVDGTLSYSLRAVAPIQNARQAHIHLGASGQNGPVVAFLFQSFAEADFGAGQVIAEGVLDQGDIIPRLPGFDGSLANLAERLRQGRAYVNLHTTAHPSGEIRGQIVVTDRPPVSRYSDPQFSWKYEVAPAGIGFINTRALGPHYEGDMIVGAARDLLEGGTLFRFKLTGNRNKLVLEGHGRQGRVADNLGKFDITESEDLLFGTGFGVGTDIQTGPNGSVFVVSLSNGEIYEIFRKPPTGQQKK
jgi:glucose/arabinose dehydrogenase